MEKADSTKEREKGRTAEKGKCTGKTAPLSVRGQTAAEAISKEKIYG